MLPHGNAIWSIPYFVIYQYFKYKPKLCWNMTCLCTISFMLLMPILCCNFTFSMFLICIESLKNTIQILFMYYVISHCSVPCLRTYHTIFVQYCQNQNIQSCASLEICIMNTYTLAAYFFLRILLKHFLFIKYCQPKILCCSKNINKLSNKP